MKNEAVILNELRSAIACVYGGLVDQALRHLDAARRELSITDRKIHPAIDGVDARVMHGLNELRDSRPTRVIEWDVTDVEVELGGEG